MTEAQNEIFAAGNEGDVAIHRAQTLARLLYEQLAEVREGERWTRDTMDRVHVLLESLEREIDGVDKVFTALWKAARRAAHPNEKGKPAALLDLERQWHAANNALNNMRVDAEYERQALEVKGLVRAFLDYPATDYEDVWTKYRFFPVLAPRRRG